MAKLTQNELLKIFNELKKLLKPYEKGTITARFDIEGKYDLWSEKSVEVAGRKYPAMAFAAAIVQSRYVGFYFMPIYSNDEVKKAIQPELLKTLKGKACFHIKNTEPVVMAEIKDALKKGYNAYKKLGWV